MGKKTLFKRIKKSFKGNSLRMRFLSFSMACWIIPLIVLGFASIMVYNSYHEEIEILALSETDYASEFCFERLSTAFDDSSDSTFDKVVEDCYVNYLKGDIGHDDLNRLLKRYINNKYIGERFCMADIVFDNRKLTHFYLSNNSLAAWNSFKNENFNILSEFSAAQTAKTGVCVTDNKIFIVHKLVSSGDLKNSPLEPLTQYGLFVLQLDEKYLFEHFMSNAFWDGKMAYIFNDFSGMVGNCPDDIFKKTSESILLSEDGEKNKIITGSRHTNSYSLNFSYVLFPSFKKVNSMDNYYSIVLLIVLMLSIPLLGVGLFFFYHKFNKPIDELIGAMQSIEAGNLDVNIDYEHEDEFKYLIDNFNSMSKEIKFLFDYNYKEELALKDARLMALQSQINPHFLNNTLEMMNWKARLSGDEELSHMIEALSTMLDAGMNRSKQQLVPLTEELKCVDAYIFIISKRFGDRLKVEKDIDYSLGDFRVPPLIIQPLAENAVIHGLEPAGGGTLTLRVYAKNEFICVEVENDGKVITEEDQNNIKNVLAGIKQGERESLGIKNVEERLKLLYGGRCHLEIFRSKNITTVSKISIGKEETAKIYN
ncbi:MAG: sensor histidine kinase [Clostridia bacterium]|nr:sensor histidine kinase [Clostridia bacterium]